jgi:hypothetical protein
MMLSRIVEKISIASLAAYLSYPGRADRNNVGMANSLSLGNLIKGVKGKNNFSNFE